MLFETRIRKLWWELESRDEDPRTIEILKELHEVINEQIEQIHHEVSGLRRLCCPAREVLKVTDGTGQRHSLCSADLQISVYRAASVVLITAKTACLYEEIRNTGQASREPVHPFAAWRPLIPQPRLSTEHPHCSAHLEKYRPLGRSSFPLSGDSLRGIKRPHINLGVTEQIRGFRLDSKELFV